MTENVEKIDQETFESLLPWYVSGRLGETESEQVSAFLKDNPEFSMQLDLIKEEQEEVYQSHEMLGTPSAGALDKLMKDIEAEKSSKLFSLPKMDRIFEAFSEFFGSARPVAFATAMAVIIVQMIAIGALMFEPQGSKDRYIPASGPESKVVAKGSVVLMAFAGEASIADVTELLSSMDAKVIKGPEANGMFRVQVSDKKLSDAELQKVIKDLRSHTKIVKLVLKAN